MENSKRMLGFEIVKTKQHRSSATQRPTFVKILHRSLPPKQCHLKLLFALPILVPIFSAILYDRALASEVVAAVDLWSYLCSFAPMP